MRDQQRRCCNCILMPALALVVRERTGAITRVRHMVTDSEFVLADMPLGCPTYMVKRLPCDPDAAALEECQFLFFDGAAHLGALLDEAVECGLPINLNGGDSIIENADGMQRHAWQSTAAAKVGNPAISIFYRGARSSL